jgi:hypothetical protein
MFSALSSVKHASQSLNLALLLTPIPRGRPETREEGLLLSTRAFGEFSSSSAVPRIDGLRLAITDKV